jgi:hypothetical protein
MLVARPARRSLRVAIVDGTLVVVPFLWAFVDLVVSHIVRGAVRSPAI